MQSSPQIGWLLQVWSIPPYFPAKHKTNKGYVFLFTLQGLQMLIFFARSFLWLSEILWKMNCLGPPTPHHKRNSGYSELHFLSLCRWVFYSIIHFSMTITISRVCENFLWDEWVGLWIGQYPFSVSIPHSCLSPHSLTPSCCICMQCKLNTWTYKTFIIVWSSYIFNSCNSMILYFHSVCKKNSFFVFSIQL